MVYRAQRGTAATRAAGAILLACLAAMVGTSGATGASQSAVVTATVPSAISVTDSCDQQPAWDLGTVLPGSTSLTATDADVCRFSFESSNDTSMLRIRQADGTGAAFTSAPGFTTALDFPDIVDASSPDGTIIYIVGDGPIAGRWDGAAWTDTALSQTPNAVSAPDASMAVAVGGVGRTWSTTDGSTWTLVASGSAEDLSDVYMIDTLTGYAVGRNGTALKTTDGGSTWADMASFPTVDSNAVVVASGSLVAIGNQAGQVVTSTDGGASWSVDTAGTCTSTVVDVHIVSGLVSWAACSGSVSLTTDGTTWTDVPVVPTGQASGIVASSATQATVASRTGEIFTTSDGGTSWSETGPGTTHDMRTIEARPGSSWVLTGDPALVLESEDSGATWTVAREAAAPMHDIEALDHDEVIAVGERGFAFRTTDTGATWTRVTTGTTGHLHGVARRRDTDELWIVGAGDTVLHSDDRGATFAASSTGTGAGLLDVAVTDAGALVAVGAGGTIATSPGAGQPWTARASGTTEVLRAVAMFDESSGWAVGDDSTALATSDGGVSWTPAATVPESLNDRYDVTALSATTAVAVGSSGKVWRTDDGTNWAEVANITGGTTMSIDSLEGRILWTGSSGSNKRRSTDGGLTWDPNWGGPGETYRGVSIVGADTAWYAGDRSRLVLHATPGIEVADYAAGVADWTGNGTSMFGVCLQAVGGAGVANWTVDTGGTPGLCEASDGDDWGAVPATATKVAHTSTAGDSASVDLVFGFRAGASQAPGDYFATVMLEAVAPNA